MADILTQVQDEMDMLLFMMQSHFTYIKDKAPPSIPPGQPEVDSFNEREAKTAAENQATQTSTEPSQLTQAPPILLTQEEFQSTIKEFARDMVLKQQQIEYLIANLPGANTSEEEQIARMKQLEGQLEELETERLQAVKEKDMLRNKVEEKIMGVGRMR
ncbi:hypothetical protein P153DRAFT_377329 [Dothidotthia symphoricarpi CBS 119687]|uniref:Mediator of RNA polymerase II transcription subunit 21 n=1 Tax=Dothidotthia symphoricarpi CBS 119687 TaxID=1392245 RepID=A0A6A6AAF7_9PLEO|nr:uncharacterized protein P153DRAFT_377329 [Dothidotthia symphoricarpi CBS 119687]KAF2127827.1 hypothetical protein P153DRAFT_377329 [Dothidotthia symphoricarpi CBS 119687]